MDLTKEDWDGLASYLGATDWQMVGSTYALGQGNDVDYLFLVKDMSVACEFLNRKRWALDSKVYKEMPQFLSFKAGRMNALITEDAHFFSDFIMAAEVCKVLRLEKREDRVKVHQILLYGATAECFA
jgi:hypothetical protein